MNGNHWSDFGRCAQLVRLIAICAPVVANGAQSYDVQDVIPPGQFEVQRLLETTASDLLIQSGGFAADGDGVPRDRVSRVDTRGRVIAEYSIPTVWPQVVRLGDAFVFTRRTARNDTGEGESHEVLITSGRAGDAGRLLYRATGLSEIRVRPGHDTTSIYIAETRFNYRVDIVRIDSSGRESARTALENWQLQDFVALPSGVAITGYANRSARNSQLQIVGLSTSGEVVWRSNRSHPQHLSVESMVFQPPATIAFLQPKSALEEPWTLERIDALDGRNLGRIEIPPLRLIKPTPRGLLLFGVIAGQNYLSLLRPDGTTEWSRRIPIDDSGAGALVDATITPAGQLVLLGQFGVRHKYWEGSWDHGARLLRTSAQSPPSTPDCIDVDAVEIAKLERKLEASHAVAVSIERSPFGQPYPTCALPSDREYLAFLRELSGALGATPTRPNEWNLRVYLNVNPTTERYALTRYALNRLITDAPRNQITYEVAVTAARPFANYLKTTISPHLDAMLRDGERFRALATVSMSVVLEGEDALQTPDLFARLQSASAAAVAALERIPAGERVLRRDRKMHEVWPQLTLESFGRPDNPRPLIEVERTVRDLFVVPSK